MAQYIDKSALVAEIEKHLEYANNGILYAQTGIEKGLKKYECDLNAWQHCQNMCKNILSFIDTLEVKEVDLEKSISDWLFEEGLPNEEGLIDYIKETAEHFFELGMQVSNKAQKGE